MVAKDSTKLQSRECSGLEAIIGLCELSSKYMHTMYIKHCTLLTCVLQSNVYNEMDESGL